MSKGPDIVTRAPNDAQEVPGVPAGRPGDWLAASLGLAVLVVIGVIVALGGSAPAAASSGGTRPDGAASSANVSIAGTWSVVDTCTSSNCAGTKFYITAVIDQCPGSSTFTGTWPYGEVLSGTVSGHSVTMRDVGGGYDALVHMTISADGNTWTGSYTDNGGGTGTTQATHTSQGGACTRAAAAELLAQIQALQQLRDALASDKATNDYAAKVFGYAAAAVVWLPPAAAGLGSVAGISSLSADVTQQNIDALNDQINALQGQLDKLLKRKPPGKSPDTALGNSSRARSFTVVAKPVPIKLALPSASSHFLSVLDGFYRADAQVVSLQRVSAVTLSRASAAAAARQAGAAKRQWLALAGYDSALAGAWKHLAALQHEFASLAASLASGKTLTAGDFRKAQRTLKSVPSSAKAVFAALGNGGSSLAFLHRLAALSPGAVAGSVASAIRASDKIVQAQTNAVIADLQRAAALARAEAATFA